MKIEELLPVDPILEIPYNNTIKTGKEILKGKKVVFSMLTRNTGKILEKNINKIIQMIDWYVEEWKFVIYENDSTDNTKEVIAKLAQKQPFSFIYKTETHDRKQYSQTKEPERIKALAEYRNINLEFIKNNLPEYDYVVVCDSDFVDFSEDGFFHSIGILENSNISAICGNSFQLKIMNKVMKLWNYDCWAYRNTWWQDLNSTKNPYIDDKMLWFGFWILPVGSAPSVVNSAFGGMAIYYKDVYIQGKYDSLDCEHVMFHWDLTRKIENFSLALNPSQIMLMN